MIDGRLLAPAAAAWLGAVVATTALTSMAALTDRHRYATATVWVAAALGVAILVIAVMHGRHLRVRARRPASLRFVVLVIALLGLLLGVGSAAASVAALTPAPLTSWIAARATASVAGVITAEPDVRRSLNAPVWADQGRLEVRLATSQVGARGDRFAVDVPMQLRIPEGVSIPPPGSGIELVGRLSPPLGPGDAATITVDDHPEHLREVADPGPIDRWANAMRAGLRRSLEGVPAESASLVSGLSVGDDSAQPEALRRDMRTSGLSHLTAVSGGNVAVVLVFVLAIAGALRMSLVGRVVTALVALGIFVVLVGPQPSVVRAAVMGAVVVVGLLGGGRRAGPAVLCSAVLVLVVLAPALTASWGFALSVAATGGLILLAPRLEGPLGRWPLTARWPPAVREAVVITTAAQLATLPLLLAMGTTVGVAALPANLLAMPVVAPVTVLGLLSALVSPVWGPPATVLAHLAAPLAAWIAWVAHRCAQLPGAVVPWPSGWWGAAALIPAAGLAYGLRALVRRTFPHGLPAHVRLTAVVTVTGLVALWTLFPPSRRDWPPSGWAMIMCDVGQGDGLLLNAGPAQAIVVDTGPDPVRMDRCLSEAGITTVPSLVLTHFHADHVGGLAGVLMGRDVASVVVTAVRDPPEQATEVDGLVADAGLTPIVVTAGDERVAGQVRWRTLWPRRVIHAGSIPNNASLVLLAHIGADGSEGVDVALLGDVEPEAQAALGPDLAGLRVDVVKVPHHGSRYQDPRLTAWIEASVALISVGAGNDYGHPAQSTIDAWRAAGALVARTDEVGDVAIVDGPGSGIGVVVRHGMLPSS